MKIERNPVDVSGARPAHLEPQRGDAGKGARQVQGTAADRVRVSSDAVLASAAVKAAHEAPEIRMDVVERVRRLIAEGQLGHDPERLADAIIDRLLEQK